MRDDEFHLAYKELETRMSARAEADGDVFIPNPQPEGPVDYVLICMEPSLGRWARTADEARSKVASGFRNFLSHIDTIILHFCARHYLCRPGERYHITDLSKGAMHVRRAGVSRYERYDRWYSLLQDEINLLAPADAGIVAVGKVVCDYLAQKCFKRPFTGIIHYSGQAGRARNEAIRGREELFKAFRHSVSSEALVATAKAIFERSGAPWQRAETLSHLDRTQLTTSRKKLIFNYKVSFESMQTRVGSVADLGLTQGCR